MVDNPYLVSSPTGESPKTERWFRWRLLFLIFAIPTGLLVLLLFALRVAWTIREDLGRQTMQAELNRLLDEGVVIGNDAVYEQYRMSTSDAHTEQWLNLFDRLSSDEFQQNCKGVPLLDDQIDLDDFENIYWATANSRWSEAAIAFTNKEREFINEVLDLLESPEPVYFPIYFDSFNTLLTETQQFRGIARILVVDSQVAIHWNDSDRLFRDTIALLSASPTLDAQPTSVSRLTSIAVRGQALRIIQQAIQVGMLSDEQLQEIERWLMQRIEIGDRWSRIMLDDLALGLPVFFEPHRYGRGKTDKPIPPRGHDAVHYIRSMERAASIPTSDWAEFYRQTTQMERDLEDEVENGRWLDILDHMMSHLIQAAYGTIAKALIRDAQLHRQACVAIAIRRYWVQHKTFPTGLGQLNFDGMDFHPYGTKPFGYRCEGNSALLWGFHLEEAQQTPDAPPNIDEASDASMRNREVVWRIGAG